MLESIKQIFLFAKKTKKIWLLPIVLALLFLAILIVAVDLSPVPLFIYPLI